MELPSVLAYRDYRLFLKDLYRSRKVSERRYSYHVFSKELGFSASNFLYLVIGGRRNLSLEAIQHISDRLPWSALEAKYFLNLVLFNQASSPIEKKKHEKTLKRILEKQRSVVDPDQYAYFNAWYVPVLREIVALKNFVSNLNWMSKKLKPRIDEEEIRKALALLERLGFVVHKNGKWKQNTEHLTTGLQVSSDVIAQYHRELINLSLRSLDLPAGDRDVSALTMGLSERQYEWVQKRAAQFRDEIQQELQNMDDPSTMVAQLNMQLFPVTEK